MRDYSKVGPKFWIGPTGKRLRTAGMEAQVVAMYLLTSPHANMLGLYYCPAMFIAHETGLGIEGATKGLHSAIEAGFCEYDEASEVVWVVEMAKYQVGEALKPNDLRVKGVQNEYVALPENPFLTRFYEKYGAAFCMSACRGNVSPLEAPSKPLRSQEQEQEQKKEQEQEQERERGGPEPDAGVDEPTCPPAAQPARSRPPTASRLPENWTLPKAWGEWALGERPDWTADHVRRVAEQFRDYWLAKAGADARKVDWAATWRTWVRREDAGPQASSASASAGDPLAWATTWPGIEAKGRELGLEQGAGEHPQAYRRRVYAASGLTPDDLARLRADFGVTV